MSKYRHSLIKIEILESWIDHGRQGLKGWPPWDNHLKWFVSWQTNLLLPITLPSGPFLERLLKGIASNRYSWAEYQWWSLPFFDQQQTHKTNKVFEPTHLTAMRPTAPIGRPPSIYQGFTRERLVAKKSPPGERGKRTMNKKCTIAQRSSEL